MNEQNWLASFEASWSMKLHKIIHHYELFSFLRRGHVALPRSEHRRDSIPEGIRDCDDTNVVIGCYPMYIL